MSKLLTQKMKTAGNVVATIKTSKSINLGAILGLSAMVYLVYFLLITERFLPFSVSSVLRLSSQWPRQLHILAVGLVPICLGLMLFGAAVLSLYLGAKIQRLITKLWS